jgi:hypothetical protein
MEVSMLNIAVGIFFLLHGLVHLLYFGQSGRYFELRPGMTWPDGSWLFSRLLGNEKTRVVATVSLVLTALGFIVGGAGLFFRQEWWRPAAMGAAAFSALIFIVFWDGSFRALDAKGGIGILIDLAVLAVIVILKWIP